MDIVKLKARTREGKGKSYARKSRAKDWIPAVFYGHGEKTEHVEVNAAEYWALVRARKDGHLIDLGLPGKSEAVAVIKDVQKHPVRDTDVLHLDFQHVSMSEKITIQTRVEVVGVPVGVKEEGGILEHPVRELTIECLPMDMPEQITVDVSKLNLGDTIHVEDLNIPKVEIKNSPDEVVAQVNRPNVEVTPAEGEEGEAAEGEAAEGEGGESAAEKSEG